MSSKTPKVTLNNEQGLYVVHHGSGYTCLGFDVCVTRSRELSQWLSRHGVGELPSEPSRGTIAAYRRYALLCDTAAEICRRKNIRCDIELVPELTGKEGQCVEVVDCYGDRRRFIVGKSAGWMPIHLEMARSDSVDGCGVTGTPFRSVRVVQRPSA